MAQSLLTASFESGAGPAFVARHGQTAAEYQATFDEWTGKKYQPVCVSVYRDGTTARYASIFHQKNGVAFAARHGMDGNQYQSQVTTWTKEGYRPRSLSAATIDGKTLFACVYEKNGSAEWVARHGLSAADYQTVFNDTVGKGFRPRAVCPYTVDGKDHYIAWWEKSPGNAWVARHGLSESAFRQTHESLAAQGYDLMSGGSCLVGSSDRYAGIWEKRSASSIGHHGMTSGAYQANFEAALAQKLRPPSSRDRGARCPSTSTCASESSASSNRNGVGPPARSASAAIISRPRRSPNASSSTPGAAAAIAAPPAAARRATCPTIPPMRWTISAISAR